VTPSAAALIDSLRGVGYSLQTAVADVIDNSIAARATVVEVGFEWGDGTPRVTILDNGIGMNDLDLERAMRFGGDGPEKLRTAEDLGRFGLGLKTASLSQCRRLTVASVRNGERSTLRWDLDHIRKHPDSWELLEGCESGSESFLEPLWAKKSGTLVLWELVDFGARDEVINRQSFHEDLEVLEQHLAMVFHRFLSGDARRVSISLNGRKITGWDPFLEDNPATRRRSVQSIPSTGGRIIVRGFALPHRDRFKTEQEYVRAGGPAGWNAQQGFYIYRNKRLLAAGGWLGLGGSRVWTREESSRLGRIRVDIPNTADQDWKIDVKKSVARPPASLRPRLSGIAQDVRQLAREVFVHRGNFGPRAKADQVERIWEPAAKSENVRYRIRRDHPAVQAAMPADPAVRAAFEAVLVLAERTVPIDRIWLDVTENPSAAGVAATPVGPDDELTDAACALANILIRKGVTREDAIQRVAGLDPYNAMAGFADKLALSV
jgi:hypothetical protein